MDRKIQNFFESINGKKIALCGIGRSNLPLIELFTKYGAKVIACDKRTKENLGELSTMAQNAGATLSLGENYLNNLDADIVFRTPGMRYYMDELVEMRKNGVVVTSEMEVFFDLCPCKIFAVTGSDGKTTTTTIISEFFKADGKNVHLGGNIGRPLLPDIEKIKSTDVAIVELSSFQLISMRTSPNVAVVTNLAPNHLDIHKDMQEYIDAKKNVVLHQNAFNTAVLNLDNELSNSFERDCRGRVLKFSRKNKCSNGAWIDENGEIKVTVNGNTTSILNKNEILIPGEHNVENYLAAISATWGYVSIASVKKVATTFSGVEHRAEFVRELNGVKYYNDAIATSPTRTALGTLSLYDFKIILIAGGYDKKVPYDQLGNVIAKKVKLLILFGATADKIEAAVKNSEYYSNNNPKIVRVQNMEEAVATAHSSAIAGDLVSMSPASASFDMYANFAEKGIHFKNLVNNL